MNPVLKGDSARCYYPSELRAIALSLIHGKECDTLLKVFKQVIITKDTIIESQTRTIDKQYLRYINTENLVAEGILQQEAIKKSLKKAKRRLVWTKIGWATTSVVLIATTVLSLIK